MDITHRLRELMQVKEQIRAELTPIDIEKAYKKVLDNEFPPIGMWQPITVMHAVRGLAYEICQEAHAERMVADKIYYKLDDKYYYSSEVQEIKDKLMTPLQGQTYD